MPLHPSEHWHPAALLLTAALADLRGTAAFYRINDACVDYFPRTTRPGSTWRDQVAVVGLVPL